MIVDTSALIAMVRLEPGWAEFRDKLLAAPQNRMSAATLVELRMVATGLGVLPQVAALIRDTGIVVVAVDERQAEVASEGFRLYGKGRHPAALNLGDLFAYALAKTTDETLLFKGDDFARTDIVAA